MPDLEKRKQNCQELAHVMGWQWWGVSGNAAPYPTAMFHVGVQPYIIPYELVLKALGKEQEK
jgi:hypothetical protein